MRKMKDSGIPWIGEIPISWTVRRLKNVATVQTGSTPSKTMQTSYYSDTSGLPWIKPENLGINTPISETAEYLTYEGKVSARLFPPNTVYVCCIGSIGKTGYSFTEASCNQQVNAIVFLNMFWKYGYYVTIAQESEYLSNASGNVVKILNSETQKNIVFPYPSLKEQRNIANFLDAECARIDAIIEQTRATVEEYKKLKQSIITQAVTKGIRPNRPMKDSGIEWIGEIPEEWEVQRFKNVTKINGRIGFRGYTTDDLVSEGEGAITLSPSNIVDLKIIYEKCSYISWEKYNESPEIQIQNGDVIFVKTGSSYGKSGIVNDLPLQATINPQLVVFKEISTDHRYFLYFLQTQSVRNEIEGIVSGGTIPTMAQEKMKNFHICVPPEREQKEIADHIDLRVAAINDIIEKKLSFIVELGSYKKSLIYEYVTGKKEAC